MSQGCLNSLMPAHWKGLPLYGVQRTERKRWVDHVISTPLLVYWASGGVAVDVYRTPRQHWHYRSETNHFDLYAQGEYDLIMTDDADSHRLVVALPQEMTAALLDAVDVDELELGNCRFQFVDRMLERLVRRLEAHAGCGEPLGSLYSESLSVAILRRMASQAQRPRRSGNTERLSGTTERRLVELIESNLANPPSIADMALVCGLRTSDFLTSFRATFGLSPHQYLLERRVEKARQLLHRHGALTAIALELGFASHAHFSATFRARTGVTPSDYRDRAGVAGCA